MRYRLWIWIIVIFAIGALAVIFVELQSEKNYKKAILSSKLESYAEIVSRTDDYEKAVSVFPDEIRLTVVAIDGKVIFDSNGNTDSLGNHLNRPEINDCLLGEKVGYSLRESESLGVEYFYYARKYGDVVIRTALPFEIGLSDANHTDVSVIVSVVLAFVVALLLVMLLFGRYGKHTSRLNNERLQAQKRQMTNNIAHELRTPVTSIRGYLETLINNPEIDSERKNLFMQRAYNQSLRLSDLIRDIALITKIEDAPEMLEKQHIGVRKITEEVLEEFSAQLHEKEIKVENCISEQCFIMGNPILVYAIFRNLVENSIRYSGGGIIIHIESELIVNDKVSFVYYDTGVGVLPDKIDKIFERFYRITPTDGRLVDGSGLGLSIVRNAVAFHGGTIKAENISPHGLKFSFTLEAE